MTRDQYLLTCLAEECAELAQSATKAIRFGLDPDARRPAQWRDVDNRASLQAELNDLVSVCAMLGINPDWAAAEKKAAKVERYLALSRELGQVD